MSLLQKASIITTPTAYAEDYLYSIKPAIPYGEELVSSWTNNDFSSFSSNGTTITQMVSSGSGNNCYSLATFESGKTYELQFNISQNITAQIRMSNNINLTSAQVVLSNPTSGLNSVIFTANANYVYVGVYAAASFTDTQITKFTLRERTDADFDFDRNSTGTRVNEDYLIETVATNTPRIDYTNGEGSILLEPQRQNLLTYSQDFTQWGNARTTDTANQITSPDGLNNGTLLQQQSGQTNAGSIFIGGLGLASGTYTQSIYAKKKDKNFIVGYDANADRTYFNLETGKVGTVASGVTAEMIAMPNDWYRCIITYTITTGAVIAFYLADNDNSTTVTDSGGVYIYGAQLEVGSYPTSLIHTSGSTVTRSQDLADNAGNSDLINSTEGVFYLQFAAFTGAGAFDDLSISDGTQNNKVQLFYRATDKINARVTVGGVTVFDYIYQSIDMTEFEKVAIKWKLNDFSMYVDGREVNSDSLGATFSANTLNEVKINDNNISDYEGKIKCLAVFKEALTDLELEKLTGYNNHELYMNYYNRLSYLGLVEEYNVESDINNYIL